MRAARPRPRLVLPLQPADGVDMVGYAMVGDLAAFSACSSDLDLAMAAKAENELAHF